MASYALYPPIVDSAMPAFIGGKEESKCRVYFSLSKFNAEENFKNLHVSITKQTTGEKVVNTGDPYGKAGILIDVPYTVVQTEENLFYVELTNDKINTTNKNWTGWIPGVVYKVQLRLSQVSYADDNENEEGQATWLKNNAGKFSEWSTVCVIKATNKPNITFTNIKDSIILGSEILGKYFNEDNSEYLYSYNISLKKDNAEVYNSGLVLANQYSNNAEIRHIMKYELEDETDYVFSFNYSTNNGYEETIIIDCTSEAWGKVGTAIEITTIENDYDVDISGKIVNSVLKNISTIALEEEEGRICFCLHGREQKSDDFSGVYYIRRTDSESNFTVWEDIKRIEKTGDIFIFDNEIYYDYTAESGIWYQYGIQGVNAEGIRGPIMKSRITHNDGKENEYKYSLRDYEYSYLVGKNEKQLKLEFDNTMDNFKINVSDSNATTIGSAFPYIRRIGAIRYKSFPVNATISFFGDENHLFASDVEIFGGNKEVADLYINRLIEQGKYDFIKEKMYREKVMEFLLDGKPKLFKSPTEGNIIVRLTDVNFKPNQILGRLVYSFSANALEVAEASVDNCFKYGITSLTDHNAASANATQISHKNIDPATHLAE